MKPIFLLLSFFHILNFSPANSSTANDCEQVELPAGTTIILETNERLSSDLATVGQLIRCKVKTDIVVEGKAVIRTGAQAIARVSKIQKNTYNEPESIIITAISVQATDGQQLAIHGIEQSIKGQFPNQGVEIKPNTLLSGSIANNYQVKIQ